jgi:hypothetical protein
MRPDSNGKRLIIVHRRQILLGIMPHKMDQLRALVSRTNDGISKVAKNVLVSDYLLQLRGMKAIYFSPLAALTSVGDRGSVTCR